MRRVHLLGQGLSRESQFRRSDVAFDEAFGYALGRDTQYPPFGETRSWSPLQFKRMFSLQEWPSLFHSNIPLDGHGLPARSPHLHGPLPPLAHCHKPPRGPWPIAIRRGPLPPVETPSQPIAAHGPLPSIAAHCRPWKPPRSPLLPMAHCHPPRPIAARGPKYIEPLKWVRWPFAISTPFFFFLSRSWPLAFLSLLVTSLSLPRYSSSFGTSLAMLSYQLWSFSSHVASSSFW
jgi:hypothetical protein